MLWQVVLCRIRTQVKLFSPSVISEAFCWETHSNTSVWLLVDVLHLSALYKLYTKEYCNRKPENKTQKTCGAPSSKPWGAQLFILPLPSTDMQQQQQCVCRAAAGAPREGLH